MIDLNRITIICIDCYNYGKAVAALQKCNEQVKAARTVLLTDIQLKIDGIETIQIPTINSKEQYSEFVIKKLTDYFFTDFVLIIQHDGFIISGEIWNDEFYNYDYVGAPWLYTDGKNVGNGGFSLRSKKLQDILAQDELIKASDPEDQAIGRLYRDYLIKEYAIKFPSEELADTFSYELREPKCKTFGFHGRFHATYQPTIILKRSAALGDCIILEPVLRYYAMKGYNIVLDVPSSFFELYNNHYFPIKHISQFDRGRIKPEKEINLDLAYEVKPRQNYLKSYFEFCGITDYQLSRPQLYPLVNEQTKLFKKYACVHIDERETANRNTYGVNWRAVQRYLENNGYVVLQIGKNKHESCGIEINTQAVGFMKYVISGCDLFIGVDSAPAGIAVAYNKPCVILFGSVNPDYIHPDLTDVEIIQGACDNSFCWHSKNGGTSGVECKYINTEKYLQCCKSDADMVIGAIEKLVKK
jgi:ADP-heptose:LPS heptosyltransferase